MESIAEHKGSQPTGSTHIDIDLLKSWHQDYIAIHGNTIDAESDVIKILESDELDYDWIEKQVQGLISTGDVTQGFCAKCRHLFEHWPKLGTKDWDFAIGRSLHTYEIEAATRAGCRFCAFLLSQLNEVGILDTFRKIERRLFILQSKETASLSIQDWAGITKTKCQLLWLNFPGKVTSHCNSNGAQITKFQSHILSPTAKLWQDESDPWNIANIWLRACTNSHENCRSIKTYQRPTRLISVSNGSVKLVETSTWTTIPKYATLSYCWGHAQFTKLTLDKFDSFLNGILFEDLPKTFKDAIDTTRKLGLSYVWIDALCIIQDDDDNKDWLKEAGMMRSVYGGGYVNLAASSARNVHGGFFLKEQYYNGGCCAQVKTSEDCRVQNFHTSSVYEDASINSHLAQRAWSYQEKLLSPRTLYFGDKGLFWECRSSIKSKFLPDGFPGKLGSQLVCPDDKALNWSAIVRYYSGANLTYSSDRLPALSGIARRQHEVTNDRYLAGMWRESLVKQLPWMLVDPQHKRERPSWRAPTWSWASVDGQTSYWGYWNHSTLGQHEYIKVLDVWTTPSGPDVFGAVTGGELSIGCSALVCGRLIVAGTNESGKPEDSNTESVLLEFETQPLAIMMDCLADKSTREKGFIYLLPVFGGHSGAAYKERTDDEDEELKDEDDKGWVNELIIRGIVLQSLDDAKGHFCRIGSFEFLHGSSPSGNTEEQRNHYDQFMRVLDERGSSTAEAVCSRILLNTSQLESPYVITIS